MYIHPCTLGCFLLRVLHICRNLRQKSISVITAIERAFRWHLHKAFLGVLYIGTWDCRILSTFPSKLPQYETWPDEGGFWNLTMTSVFGNDCFKKCQCHQGNSPCQLKHHTGHPRCWVSLRQFLFGRSAVTNPVSAPWHLNSLLKLEWPQWMVFLSFSCVGAGASGFLSWGCITQCGDCKILATEKQFCILHQNEFKFHCIINPKCFWQCLLRLHYSSSFVVLLQNTQHITTLCMCPPDHASECWFQTIVCYEFYTVFIMHISSFALIEIS